MRLGFLGPGDLPLANAEVTLLGELRKELLQRPGIVEDRNFETADALVLHEPWAFREWRYIDRLIADPVIGRFAHKVYTVNSDDAGTGLLRGAYCCLPTRRFEPGLHAAIPFFTRPNEEVLAQAGTPRPRAPLLATWRGNPKSNRRLRGHLLEMLARNPSFQVESTESWLDHGEEEKLHYVRLLRSGKFSLCPAGWGAASIRIFESMALGVAPVIIADEFVEPAGPDWRSFSLRVREADLGQLEDILRRHLGRHEAMGERAYEAWRKYFQPRHLMGFYADALLGCMRANAAPGSPKAEIERWRSHRMYQTNGWTVPQRLSNRLRRMMKQ
ncbi:exostosin family protein [Variovorax sp. OV329]|uniref:exostosin domain-containing protein n=1 Tax=Variovorax sp. OV329 TaxID=1882825 RepID=UPI0008E861FD|nr:exostosin family protein [Variovorax sp. OV329]SFM21793.1 Exostosin family protein [Variovorax sp. OV329]